VAANHLHFGILRAVDWAMRERNNALQVAGRQSWLNL
jgi:hypothetical protein